MLGPLHIFEAKPEPDLTPPIFQTEPIIYNIHPSTSQIKFKQQVKKERGKKRHCSRVVCVACGVWCVSNSVVCSCCRCPFGKLTGGGNITPQSRSSKAPAPLTHYPTHASRSCKKAKSSCEGKRSNEVHERACLFPLVIHPVTSSPIALHNSGTKHPHYCCTPGIGYIQLSTSLLTPSSLSSPELHYHLERPQQKSCAGGPTLSRPPNP